jgi:hypothetical protein
MAWSLLADLEETGDLGPEALGVPGTSPAISLTFPATSPERHSLTCSAASPGR